ncbi:MAG: exodeoxyribonuclease VII large subunit [Bacteroidales bacterium]
MAEALSLHELNNLIKLALKECFPETFWVRAELSEVRTTGAGHCYVEFVEKDNRNGAIVAKMRGNIWANTFRLLKPYFEEETGQPFVSGLKVLVKVTVDFHEVYGPSLTISDIDPTFTVGDMIRQRLEIIRRLKEEEIFDQNRELTFPVLAQRLAIISSATAAGFDDFMNQLRNNSGEFVFYSKLFPALMQGEQAESSILKALKSIEKQLDAFDVVVIIRGGGAVSDLNCFDSFALAKRCATFPLPIVTGIGHERDESILDMVAHSRMKTPTAAAEFLISCFEESEKNLYELYNTVVSEAKSRVDAEANRLKNIGFQLSNRSNQIVNNTSANLMNAIHMLKNGVRNQFLKEENRLKEYRYSVNTSVKQRMTKEENRLALFEQTIRLSSPETMLRKGFTLTTKNGKAVRSANDLCTGDQIITHFADGAKESIVSK